MKDNIVKHRWILLWGKKEVSLYYQNDIWSFCYWILKGTTWMQEICFGWLLMNKTEL